MRENGSVIVINVKDERFKKEFKQVFASNKPNKPNKPNKRIDYTPPLFPEKPSWTQVRQSTQLSNCYFMAPIQAAMLRNSDVIHQIIREDPSSKKRVIVRLYYNGQAYDYRITKNVPRLSAEDGRPLWLCLIEKAYAMHCKQHHLAPEGASSYKEHISWGNPGDVYGHLFNSEVSRHALQPAEDDQSLAEKMTSVLNSGGLISTITPKENPSKRLLDGLYPLHVYHVINVKKSATGEYTVILGNPHQRLGVKNTTLYRAESLVRYPVQTKDQIINSPGTITITLQQFKENFLGIYCMDIEKSLEQHLEMYKLCIQNKDELEVELVTLSDAGLERIDSIKTQLERVNQLASKAQESILQAYTLTNCLLPIDQRHTSPDTDDSADVNDDWVHVTATDAPPRFAVRNIRPNYGELPCGRIFKITDDQLKQKTKRVFFSTVQFSRVSHKLFTRNPSITDIQQGIIGDCYLLSALQAIILRSPKLLSEIIRDLDDGYVQVTFWHNQQPYYYRIEKTVAVMQANRNSAAPWVALIEKAYVCHRQQLSSEHRDQSYSGAIGSGWTSDAFQHLLGIEGEYQCIDTMTSDEVEKLIVCSLANGGLVGASTADNQKLQPHKLRSYHAYCVEKIVGDRIYLLDPHGKTKMPSTDDLKGCRAPGKFSMSISEFHSAFSMVYRVDFDKNNEKLIERHEKILSDQKELEKVMDDKKQGGQPLGECRTAWAALQYSLKLVSEKIRRNHYLHGKITSPADSGVVLSDASSAGASVSEESPSDASSTGTGVSEESPVTNILMKLTSYLDQAMPAETYQQQSFLGKVGLTLFSSGQNRQISQMRRERAYLAKALIETYNDISNVPPGESAQDQALILKMLQQVRAEHQRYHSKWSNGWHGDRLGACLNEIETLPTANSAVAPESQTLSSATTDILRQKLAENRNTQLPQSLMQYMVDNQAQVSRHLTINDSAFFVANSGGFGGVFVRPTVKQR